MDRLRLDVVRLRDGAAGYVEMSDGVVEVYQPGRLGSRSLSGPALPEEVGIADDEVIELWGDEYVAADGAVAAEFIAAVRAQQIARGGSRLPDSFTTALDPASGDRWQYAVINLGMFNTPERMTSVLADAGRVGWELVTVYDKTSNWWASMEKGFMLLKRQVPHGVEPEEWCIQLRG